MYRHDSSNYDVYKKSVDPMLELFVAGFNTCVVITGEQGSGKSYTLAGESVKNSGMAPLLIEHLFARMGEGRYILLIEHLIVC